MTSPYTGSFWLLTSLSGKSDFTEEENKTYPTQRTALAHHTSMLHVLSLSLSLSPSYCLILAGEFGRRCVAERVIEAIAFYFTMQRSRSNGVGPLAVRRTL